MNIDAIVVLTTEDRKLLRHSFAENENEVILFRAFASLALSLRHTLDHCNIGMAMLQRTLDLVARSPAEDAAKVISTRPRMKTVQQSLDCVTDMALVLMQGTTPRFDRSSQAPRGTALWGGKHCDCCGKTATKVPKGLLICGRCELMYYCSKECQQKDWVDGGHKKVCHKKDCIQVGEYMVFRQQTSQMPQAPHIVKIVEPIQSTPGCWAVSSTHDGSQTSFPVWHKNLVSIRQDMAEDYLLTEANENV